MRSPSGRRKFSVRTGSRKHKPVQKKKEGLVLLSVLLVCLFLLTASTGFALFARRLAAGFDREKRAFTARMVASAALPAAKLLISQNAPPEAHAPGLEPFVLRTLEFPDPAVTVEMTIHPLDDKIPINGLFLPDGKTLRAELEGPWRRLWQRVGAEGLEALVLDFLDGDEEPRLGGGERAGHLNRPLLSTGELLLLPEVTEDVLWGGPAGPGVASLVTLWSSGKINVNTALPEVLALLDGLDYSIAADLVRRREAGPFASMRDLSAVHSFPPSARARLMNVLAFKSDYFSVLFDVVFPDGQRLPIEVILGKKGSAVKTVRWEEP